MKRMYTTNNARNGTSGVVDVLFNMTISLVIDATRHVVCSVYVFVFVCACVSKMTPSINQDSNPGQLFRRCGPSSAGC